MGVANFVDASLGSAIESGTTSAFGLSVDAANKVVSNIHLLQSVASGIYYGIKAGESGNIGDFLQVTGALSGVALELSFPTPQDFDLTYQLLNTLKTVPLQIYSGIEAISQHDWLTGIQNIAGDLIPPKQLLLVIVWERKSVVQWVDIFTTILVLPKI